MKPGLRLSDEEQMALVRVRDHDRRPYVRERAAALLQLAAGRSSQAVAREGLLRPRHPATVAHWRERYKVRGLASLSDDRPGQRRTGSFSPSAGAGDRDCGLA